jgi:hypothetical protein
MYVYQRPTLMKTEQAWNGLYPVSYYNRPIIFNHWHIWSVTSIIFLEEFFQLSSTTVKSSDMKQTEKHFSNKHIYKASSAEFNIKNENRKNLYKNLIKKRRKLYR